METVETSRAWYLVKINSLKHSDNFSQIRFSSESDKTLSGTFNSAISPKDIFEKKAAEKEKKDYANAGKLVAGLTIALTAITAIWVFVTKKHVAIVEKRPPQLPRLPYVKS